MLPDTRNISCQHDFLLSAKPVLASEFERAFKFAIVRNPWDRFVSWYSLIGQTTNRLGTTSDLADPSHPHWREFDQFLETWSADLICVEGVARRKLSQWDQLTDVDGELLVNDYGRFESLSDDIDRMLGGVGLDTSGMPRVNGSRHNHYSMYYSEFGRALVAERFRTDIEEFGYSFDSDLASS